MVYCPPFHRLFAELGRVLGGAGVSGGLGVSSGVNGVRLDTGAPSGYLDPYPQVFSEKNPYLDLQRSFPMVHLDPQVFYLRVAGQKILKVPAGIQ